MMLRVYPELASLNQSSAKRLAAAVYQLNRTAQIALETFHRNKPVKGLSRRTLPCLLGLIENSLHRIQMSSDAQHFGRFLSQERGVLGANRAQWSELETRWWPEGMERIP
ncbi:MAG: hypothetical protein ETSY1_39290 [Candidatus Entotheonella factor]|uniref:Four helix bundle protein n=1 Tax=Entotheonella factor TaxID=1429438 RepID=W4L6W9_ENTF1|nr:MAG: hypothetical protein ETSY1_39290 [Candidatus Entotheonella factor]